MNKDNLKNIMLEWLKKEENDHNYTCFFDNNLSSVTLDGSFDLQDLIDRIYTTLTH
jgi:hypothetical protein